MQNATDPYQRGNYRCDYNKQKAIYRRNILTSKEASWRAFCTRVDTANPYTLPYKIATSRTRKKVMFDTITKEDGSQTTTHQETVTWILESIFQKDNPATDDHLHKEIREKTVNYTYLNNDIPLTIHELEEVIKNTPSNKAPGKDNIPIEIIKAAFRSTPETVFRIYEQCFKLEYFPTTWKKVKVILLNKPGKDPGTLAAYRPISLLDSSAKILDKIIANRTYHFLHINDIISKAQYGFMHGRSTTNAIKNIIDSIIEARNQDNYITMICLDVKSAFDKVWVPYIMRNLIRVKYPRNLYNLLASYLYDRRGIFTSSSTDISFDTQLGVPQGSSIGPILWNLALNPVLETALPEGCRIQAFADDLCLLVEGTSRRQMEDRGNRALGVINTWSLEAKLDFSVEKSSAMTFKKLKPPKRMPIYKLRNEIIKHASEVTYLGVLIDNNLSFIPHMNLVKDKSIKVLQGLSRISRATWGLKGNVVYSLYKTCIERIALYAVGAWWRREATSKTRLKLRSIQRLAAISITKAFRTTSTEALLTISGLIPIDLIAENEVRVFLARHYNKHLDDQRVIDLATLAPPYDHWATHPGERIKIASANKDPNNTGYEIFTDGSRNNTEAGGAFVVYHNGVEEYHWNSGMNNNTSIFNIEATAIKYALTWIKSNIHTSSTIYTDSLSTIKALENATDKNQIIRDIKLVWKSLEYPVDIAWIKAHDISKGNARADELAKAATKQLPSITIQTPISYYRKALLDFNLLTWQQEWTGSNKGRYTHKLLPTVSIKHNPDPDYYCTQILTNHGSFPLYLKEHGHRNDDSCCCGAISADANHYVWSCPLFDHERNYILENNMLIINQDTYNILSSMMKKSIINNNIH